LQRSEEITGRAVFKRLTEKTASKLYSMDIYQQNGWNNMLKQPARKGKADIRCSFSPFL
jgi:hypothetical protein